MGRSLSTNSFNVLITAFTQDKQGHTLAQELSKSDLIKLLTAATELARKALGIPDKREVSGPDGGPIAHRLETKQQLVFSPQEIGEALKALSDAGFPLEKEEGN